MFLENPLQNKLISSFRFYFLVIPKNILIRAYCLSVI